MSHRSRQLEALLAGRRVLITGGARGIGAALAKRLHQRGAKVALIGLEPEGLEKVSAACGDAPFRYCDVSVRRQVETSVRDITRELGGLDVVVANAGVAAQMAMLGGDVEVMRRTLEVNVMGVFHTLRAAGEHIGHPRGYALVVASAAVAAHLPLMGAYCASKSAVESLGYAFRMETKHLGTKVGIGYFAELDTDMTRIGFGTQAASKLGELGLFTKVTPLEEAIDRFEEGIAHRKRQVFAPAWVRLLVPMRMAVQRLLELKTVPGIEDALRLARKERAPLTTPQPAAIENGVTTEYGAAENGAAEHAVP